MAKYTSNSRNSMNRRTYSRKEAIVFRKTKEEFGGLSNMATGFPLKVNGLRIFTSEALYQACRFPHLPELQRVIIGQRNPMTAKMKSKPHRGETRADWDRVKVKIMRWCLRVKLAQNWTKFSRLLLETGDRPIVEESSRDDFWGAKVVDGQTLMGINVLGRLLMELRKPLKQSDQESLSIVEPLAIPDFLLDGRAIGTIFGQVDKVIDTRDSLQRKTWVPVSTLQRSDASSMPHPVQGLLFDSSNSIAPKITRHWGTITRLKPYPAYKESGVSWLGEIPEHWKLLPGRACYREKKVQNTGLKERTVLSLSYGQIVIKPEEKLHGLVPASFETYQIIKPEDIIIRSTDLQNDWVSLRFGLSSHQGIITSAYMCFNTQPVMCSEYGYLLLHTYDLKKVFYGFGSGLRQNLDWQDFKYLPCFVPPFPEQTAIVRYLDYMDRRIRRYINAKKKLIALLNEQKQAIIHQAVTRGLDPNVRLKPSGLEWLGDIPEQWDIRRCKYIFCCVDIRSSTGEEELLTVSSDHGIIPRKSANVTMFKAESYVGYKLCWPGDLVINSLWAWARGLGVSPYHGIISSAYGVYRLRSEREDNSKFIHELVRSSSFHWELQIRSKGIWKSRLQLTDEAFLCAPFPLPPFPEQNTIVEYLDKETADIDTAINRAQREIDLLREYRTRLIADVVTGKLDVREAAASLPEEAEQPEDIEELTDSEGMPEEVALEPAIAEATDED